MFITLIDLKLLACGWYYGLVCFLYIKLHEDSSQLSQLLKQADLIDGETMGQVDPSQTPYVNQNQFLAFAVLSLDNKGKANHAAPAACMYKLSTGSAAAMLLCTVTPSPEGSQDSQNLSSMSPRRQSSCILYLLFLITFDVWNNKIVYKEI